MDMKVSRIPSVRDKSKPNNNGILKNTVKFIIRFNLM